MAHYPKEFKPEPGSLGLCYGCGDWMVYLEDGLRLMQDSDVLRIGQKGRTAAIMYVTALLAGKLAYRGGR